MSAIRLTRKALTDVSKAKECSTFSETDLVNPRCRVTDERPDNTRAYLFSGSVKVTYELSREHIWANSINQFNTSTSAWSGPLESSVGHQVFLCNY